MAASGGSSGVIAEVLRTTDAPLFADVGSPSTAWLHRSVFGPGLSDDAWTFILLLGTIKAQQCLILNHDAYDDHVHIYIVATQLFLFEYSLSFS